MAWTDALKDRLTSDEITNLAAKLGADDARVKRYLRLLVKQAKKQSDTEEAQEKHAELVAEAFGAFEQWTAQTKMRVLATEVALVCDKLQFGGTLDGAAAEVDGVLSLSDWKTSGGIYYDYLPQVSAYVHLLEHGRITERPSGRIRYRNRNGKQIPGVTTICGRYKESEALKYWCWSQGIEGLDYKETMQKAASVGTEVHDKIEAHFNSLALDLPDPKLVLGRRIERVHLLRFDKTFGSFVHHMWPRPVIDKAWEWFKLARQMYELEKTLRKAV